MDEKIKIKLQGHEKFALREGWINKALMIIPKYSNPFTRKDAPDLFGIGTNMVKSLRYWMRALGLTNNLGTELSFLGKIIAEYDPYLENIFSLWLMHSNIAKNKSDATTWFMYFNHCDADELEKFDIEKILFREITKYTLGASFSENSLNSDVDVLLNMYSKNNVNSDPEDKNISPFSRLELVKCIGEKYLKCRPNIKNFNETLVLYEIMIKLKDQNSISIENMVNDENGLSKIYNLSSVMSNDYFDRLEASKYIRVDRTAGLDMIYLEKQMEPINIITDFYKNNKGA